MRINVAIAGGPCTGKSTLAAALFAHLKEEGFDYDLITEEHRKLARELGNLRSPFERFYIWRQQEREELRSSAHDGFITDTPLFHIYVKARRYVREPRDLLAVRELFRMCLEMENRYQLIVMAENPLEIAYRVDYIRDGGEEAALTTHAYTRSFVEHFAPDRLFFVKGTVRERVDAVAAKLKTMRQNAPQQS